MLVPLFHRLQLGELRLEHCLFRYSHDMMPLGEIQNEIQTNSATMLVRDPTLNDVFLWLVKAKRQ